MGNGRRQHFIWKIPPSLFRQERPQKGVDHARTNLRKKRVAAVGGRGRKVSGERVSLGTMYIHMTSELLRGMGLPEIGPKQGNLRGFNTDNGKGGKIPEIFIADIHLYVHCPCACLPACRKVKSISPPSPQKNPRCSLTTHLLPAAAERGGEAMSKCRPISLFLVRGGMRERSQGRVIPAAFHT